MGLFARRWKIVDCFTSKFSRDAGANSMLGSCGGTIPRSVGNSLRSSMRQRSCSILSLNIAAIALSSPTGWSLHGGSGDSGHFVAACWRGYPPVLARSPTVLRSEPSAWTPAGPRSEPSETGPRSEPREGQLSEPACWTRGFESACGQQSEPIACSVARGESPPPNLLASTCGESCADQRRACALNLPAFRLTPAPSRLPRLQVGDIGATAGGCERRTPIALLLSEIWRGDSARGRGLGDGEPGTRRGCWFRATSGCL